MTRAQSIEPCDCCPHKRIDIDKHTDGTLVLRKLCNFICDKEGSLMITRHLHLIYHYFGLRKEGIRIRDVPHLVVVLEFFSYKLQNTHQYNFALWYCLTLCQQPILLLKSSDALDAMEILKDFFSALGNCLIYVKDPDLQVVIIEALFRLLDRKKTNYKGIPIEIRQEAARESRLALILSFLLRNVSKKIYSAILDVMLQLCIFSKCVDDFLTMNAVELWLCRLPTSEKLSHREIYIKEQSSNLLWAVLRCASKNIPDSNVSVELTTKTLFNLRRWFRNEVLNGKAFERNNVAALILQLLIVNPHLNIAGAGILDDVCMLSAATEFGLHRSWAHKVKFNPIQEDLAFKKILISCVTYTFDQSLVRLAAKDSAVMGALGLYLAPECSTLFIKWSPEQSRDLLFYSLHTLPIMAKYLVTDYTQSGATTRILSLIDYYAPNKRNHEIVQSCVHCLYMLIVKGLPLTHFRELNTIPVLLRLCLYLLNKYKLTILVQVILSYSFCILTELFQDNKKTMVTYYDQTCDLSLKILKRLYKPDILDSKFDNSLFISAGDFVWQGTIANKRKTDFVDNKGIYIILDIIEIAPFPVQLLYTGMLTDACLYRHSVTQMVTWRGKRKEQTALSLLCSLWRKQEVIKNVPRDKNHCITDIEYPLMGELQKCARAYDYLHCPPLLDLFACIRPKVAAVVNCFTRRFRTDAEMGKKMYQMPYDHLSAEDEITMNIIKYYEELKEGELWWGILRDIEDKEMLLLPIDLTLTHSLAMKHLSWAVYVKHCQLMIVHKEEKKEKEYEEELVSEIRRVNLNRYLKAVNEMETIMSLSDNKYNEEMKARRNEIIRALEERIEVKMVENHHKTFTHPRDLILMKTGRNPLIRSIASRTFKKYTVAKRRFSRRNKSKEEMEELLKTYSDMFQGETKK